MRYSPQREKVYEVLCNNPMHLSADEVLALSKQDMPEIGIATVYRNLNALVEHGMVRRIKSVDGVDHYDANTKSHPHFICTKCAKVFDSEISYKDVLGSIQKQCSDDVEDVEIFIKGLCKSCKLGA